MASLPALSPAAADLGLGQGGNGLADEVKNESDEERKRRLAQLRMSQLTPGAAALYGPSMGVTGGGY
jgi:hypothetical protein